jgi:hypothetical protein
MDRKDYDEYKEVAKEAVQLLIKTRHLPLIFSSIGIDPGEQELVVALVDTAAQSMLDNKYGMARPADKRDADKLTVGLPALFWADELPNVDAVYNIDGNDTMEAKVMCRVGTRVVTGWKI